MSSAAASGARRATPARMYDYYLGGVHNFPADREAAEQVLAQFPLGRAVARANRAFLGRAVSHVVHSGVRQLLDVGSGIPTVGNVHEIAQGIAPEARVVYVDIDPVAVSEGQEILQGNDNAVAILGDLNDPQAILGHPSVREMLDFTQPVGLVLAAVLHFVADDAHAFDVVAQLVKPLPAGSYLVMSHAAAETYQPDSDQGKAAGSVYKQQAATAGAVRTRADIERFFAGFELVDPGIVWVTEWRPDGEVPPEFADHPERCGIWAAVGRKV